MALAISWNEHSQHEIMSFGRRGNQTGPSIERFEQSLIAQKRGRLFLLGCKGRLQGAKLMENESEEKGGKGGGPLAREVGASSTGMRSEWRWIWATRPTSFRHNGEKYVCRWTPPQHLIVLEKVWLRSMLPVDGQGLEQGEQL